MRHKYKVLLTNIMHELNNYAGSSPDPTFYIQDGQKVAIKHVAKAKIKEWGKVIWRKKKTI